MKKFLLFISSVVLSTGLNAQLENGLVAHFPFNGNHIDISNNTIVGVNSGTTFGLDRNGMTNGALELDGSQFYGFNDDAVKVSFPLTISAWVYLSPNSTSSQIFFSDTETGNYNGYFFQVVGATRQPAIGFGGGTGTAGAENRRSFTSDATLQADNWYHIVAIIRASLDMDIYLDGVQTTGQYSGYGPTTVAYSTTESKIGVSLGTSTYPSGTFYEGLIDQLAIWDRELTSSEITTLSNANITLSIPEIKTEPRTIVKIYNSMGQETEFAPNTTLIYVYSDGSREKVFVVD